MPNSTGVTSAPSTPSTAASEPEIWLRQPEEEDLWFDRFFTYLNLGPDRSIEQLFRVRKATVDTELTAKRANSTWRKKAKEYRWEIRAKAWDADQRQQLQIATEERRIAGRAYRIDAIEGSLGLVLTAIKAAELDKMDVLTARMHLQTLRPMLADMLKAHRLELGEPTEISDTTLTPGIQFSADDLAAAQRQLDEYFKAPAHAHAE